MDSLLFVIPLLVTITVVFCYGVGRTFLQLWAVHREKLAILRRYEEDPSAFGSSQEVIEQISEQERRNMRALRQDYTITGTCLAAMGLAAIFAGRLMGYGQTAVGLYIGGIACVGLGVLIAVLGYLVRALMRPLIEPGDPPQA